MGLEECERVNERLSVLLDVEDPIESSYTLEISTPGLDRQLWTMRDYERFTGRVAKIKTREQLDGKNRFRGRLAGVEGSQCFWNKAVNGRAFRSRSSRVPVGGRALLAGAASVCEKKAMSSLLYQTIEQISREKGIDPDVIIGAV